MILGRIKNLPMTKGNKPNFKALVVPESVLKMYIKKRDVDNLYSCPCCGPEQRSQMINNDYYIDLLEELRGGQ